MQAGDSIEIGVDTGGTFTDCIVVDHARGSMTGFKVLSTPHNPSIAIFDALVWAAQHAGVASDSIGLFLHATTVATNALIERKGSKIGLITTAGFRDILEMRRETRYDEADLFPQFPDPLVPRHLRLGVVERTDHTGTVLHSLDTEDVRAKLRQLRNQGVEAVAISFLHSYANPEHERAAADIADKEFTFEAISTSSEVQPEVREYERTSTTVANAYIQKKVQHYVTELRNGLKDRGVHAPLQIMQSNGGFAGPEVTARFPVRMVESGPAAGTISAIFHGRRAGYERLVSFDMGGTTAKIAVLTGDSPPLTHELEVARLHRFKPGSGIPLRCASVALNEIGAGGGSIATIDVVGLMRVGPQSAGADPGPACYGRGGTEPTVTDADLVLGYLDAGYFAGGSMTLDKNAAETAIAERLTRPLGIDIVRAAWGIHDIVNQNMASAARLHILEQGEDPASFAMVAFGGAGPVHAHRIAAALGIRNVLYPLNAGVASAFGLMVAPMTASLVRTHKVRTDRIDWPAFKALFAEMEQEAARDFERETVEGTSFTRYVDFRYLGQGFEVQAKLPDDFDRSCNRKALEAVLRETYTRVFGRVIHEVPLELVNLRLEARAERGNRTIDFDYHGTATGEPKKGPRMAYFEDAGGYVLTDVYDRLKIPIGATFAGPAIIEEKDTTIIVPPGGRVRIDEYRNVIVTLDVVSPVNA